MCFLYEVLNLEREKQRLGLLRYIYGKNGSSIYNIMKREKESLDSFITIPQVIKV